jgi:aspartyl aminopeptidase
MILLLSRQLADGVAHAAAQIGNRLALQDFTPFAEEEKWKLEKGKSYFVVRGGSLAHSRFEKDPSSAMILASHVDSPASEGQTTRKYKKRT